MSKQLSEASAHPDERFTDSATTRMHVLRKGQPAVFLPWLGGLLVVGLMLVGVVTYSAWIWLSGIQSSLHITQAKSSAISTVDVQRSATYADLNFTLVKVQYALNYSNDPIQSGQATIRATIQVKNPTQNTVDLVYYDIVRLLVPKQQPIAPTNLALPATSPGGSSQTGWIDFPVAKNTPLGTLQLQLGNSATSETLVTIPVSGAYDANQFNDHLYHVSNTYNYNYGPYGGKHLLIYHLNSVDVRYAYDGSEVKAGQQFYVLNFTVDNPNSVWVGPGYGFDYIRLVLGSNLPPSYATLPNGFQANASGVAGSVSYAAPAGMQHLTIAFLAQFYQGQDVIDVSL